MSFGVNDIILLEPIVTPRLNIVQKDINVILCLYYFRCADDGMLCI